MKKFSATGIVLVLLLTLVGCASKPGIPRILWPAPPEEPRLEWKGVFYSELDFPKSGLFERSMQALTGKVGEYPFKSPFDIAADNKGRVYITDVHLHNVRVFDFNTRRVSLLFRQPKLKTPLGIDVDSQGNIYIADGAQAKVLVVTPEGRILQAIADVEQLKRPVFVVVNERLGRLYVSDTSKQQIVVFDLAGNFLFAFGEPGSSEGHFNAPQGLAIDAANNVFVADTLNARVQVFDQDGKFIRLFGERGDRPYQFDNPRDLAFDSEGNLHIVDARMGQLLSYTPEGRLLLATGGGGRTEQPLGFSTPKGLFIDDNDRIYVADQLNKRFTLFQFLSAAALERDPITDEDKQQLEQFLRKNQDGIE